MSEIIGSSCWAAIVLRPSPDRRNRYCGQAISVSSNPITAWRSGKTAGNFGRRLGQVSQPSCYQGLFVENAVGERAGCPQLLLDQELEASNQDATLRVHSCESNTGHALSEVADKATTTPPRLETHHRIPQAWPASIPLLSFADIKAIRRASCIRRLIASMTITSPLGELRAGVYNVDPLA